MQLFALNVYISYHDCVHIHFILGVLHQVLNGKSLASLFLTDGFTVSITEHVWESWLGDSTSFSSALDPSSTLLYFILYTLGVKI